MNNHGGDFSAFPPFKPTAHYRRSGEQLVVYWDEAESFVDELDGRHRFSLLRALADQKMVVGVRVWGLPEVVSLFGKPDFAPQPVDLSRDEDGALFAPYAWHDADKDALRLRWLPGAEIQDEKIGHIHFALLRDKGCPELVLGMVLYNLAKILRCA